MAERYLRISLIIGCVSPDHFLKKERKKESHMHARGSNRDPGLEPGVHLTGSQSFYTKAINLIHFKSYHLIHDHSHSIGLNGCMQ